MKRTNKTWVEISAAALTQNVRTFRRHLGSKTVLMAVVKSNAYGHGMIETARIADKAGALWFGVDNVDDGLVLRKNGITKPILILGYTLNARLKECVAHDLSFVVSNLDSVKALAALKGKKKARVHIKIETGTTRQGVEGEELRALARALKKLRNVIVEGASTHYANIEDTTDTAYAKLQLKRYKEGLEILMQEGLDPEWKHTACSAAAILFPDTYFNLARVGIAMYGLWPSKETHATSLALNKKELYLKPALTWKTVVAQLKHVKKGTAVSYGLTERVSRNAVLAVLPIGYWDGYDRRGLSNTGQVLIRGHRCKVMGRICMNMCVVDVSDVPGVSVEDEVVLLGTQKRETISAEDIASKIGTINYEVVTRINPLIPRIVH